MEHAHDLSGRNTVYSNHNKQLIPRMSCSHLHLYNKEMLQVGLFRVMMLTCLFLYAVICHARYRKIMKKTQHWQINTDRPNDHMQFQLTCPWTDLKAINVPVNFIAFSCQSPEEHAYHKYLVASTIIKSLSKRQPSVQFQQTHPWTNSEQTYNH